MRTSRRSAVLVVVVTLLLSVVPEMVPAGAIGRRAARTVYTRIDAAPITRSGSPYRWKLSIFQRRDPNGTTEPEVSETATRTAATDASVSHTWTFAPAPADIVIHSKPDLTGVSVVYTSNAGYMNLDMRATDLSRLTERVTRCKATGETTQRIRTRAGVLRGTFTFYPNLAIPEFPGQVHATRMKVTLTRIISYDVACPVVAGCGRTSLTATRSGAPSSQLAVYDAAGPARIVASYATTGMGLVFSHVARAAKAGVLDVTPDTVSVHGKALAPFSDRTKLVFDKGGRTTDTSHRCRTTSWLLTVASGRLVVDFDTTTLTYDTFDAAGFWVSRSV
jgi:hypothetical protein